MKSAAEDTAKGLPEAGRMPWRRKLESDAQNETKSALEEGRRRMSLALAEGCGGVLATREFSQLHDSLVRALWEREIESSPGRRAFTLVALGGWGREELCPYSDLDMLILVPANANEADAQALAEAVLYPLWNAGLKVGHQLRSVEGVTELAKTDLATATGLLDARFIAGDKTHWQSLEIAQSRFWKRPGVVSSFLAQLGQARARRYKRFGETLYLLEPNIKHGIGGLRDLSSLVWASQARWRVRDFRDLVGRGPLNRRQATQLNQAREFLLAVRARVQLQASRSTDQLSFELQEQLGPELYPNATAREGQVVSAVAPSVEAMMRHYYLVGRDVERIVDWVLVQAQQVSRRKPSLYKLDRNFLVWNGHLAVSNPDVFKKEPEEMLRYFTVALDKSLPLYGHTKELIESEVAGLQSPLYARESASKYFVNLLLDMSDRGRRGLLHQMHDLGLVAAMIPEFEPCTARVQHDLYHVYTVDRHQLYALALLKKTGRGELGEEGRVAMAAFKRVENRRPLFLATLLHDVGKPLGAAHSQTGADIGARAARRLGMNASEIALVDFLIREHLSMSHVSQRRDLSDPDVIAKFAARVQNQEALTQLYLLTRCDTATTAPGNLSSWKDQLLSELYQRTLAHLSDGKAMQSEQAIHRRQARHRAVEIVSSGGTEVHLAARAEAFLSRLDPSFVNGLSARQLSRVVSSVLEWQDNPEQVILKVRSLRARGQSEVLCVGPNATAFLAKVAGVLAAHAVGIDSASVDSVLGPEGDCAVQVFFVHDANNTAIDEQDRRWDKVREALPQVLGDDGLNFVQTLLKRIAASGSLQPSISGRPDSRIRIFDEESSEYTLVEVMTKDLPGLLHHLTRAIASLDFDIHRALLAGEGDGVVDVFYIRNKKNSAKLGREEKAKLQRSLVSVLGGIL